MIRHHAIAFSAMQTTITAFSPGPFSIVAPRVPSISIFFDVLTKMIDVVTNSAQATPTHSALNFSWGEPCIIQLAPALQDWAGLCVVLVSTVSHLTVWMMFVAGKRLWPATAELAFRYWHIDRPNGAVVYSGFQVVHRRSVPNSACILPRIY